MTDREKDRSMKQMRKELGKQPTTAKEWLVAKTKFPTRFTLDKEGNYISHPVNSGETSMTIVVDPEVPATPEVIQSFFSKKRDGLKEPEATYTSAKRRLQEVMIAYKAGLLSVSDVLDANQEVHTAECILNKSAKLPRFINDLTGTLIERDLSLQHYADRSIPDKVTQACYTIVPWEVFWMKQEQVTPQAPGMAVAPDSGQQVQTPSKKNTSIGGIIAARKRLIRKYPGAGQTPPS